MHCDAGVNQQQLELAGMTVEALMTSGVVTIDPDDTVGRARELMLGLGIHCLPVVDAMGSVCGFITSSDLVEEWPFGEPVEAIMSRRVHAVEATALLSEAARRMIDEHVHHLLVNRDGRPVGIISSFDLLVPLAEPAE